MAPVRLACCLIVFLLMGLLSNAHFHQVNAAAEVDAVSIRKVVFTGESGVAVAVHQTVLGGRKLVASISSGRCEKKGRKKVMAHAKYKKSNGDKISEGDEKEFVAFNADYRAPRRHPPQHN